MVTPSKYFTEAGVELEELLCACEELDAGALDDEFACSLELDDTGALLDELTGAELDELAGLLELDDTGVLLELSCLLLDDSSHATRLLPSRQYSALLPIPVTVPSPHAHIVAAKSAPFAKLIILLFFICCSLYEKLPLNTLKSLANELTK
ncbi:hypothetical protein AGMMS49938_15600 [Fibrobacterales bacterium]|nr:hypothetical protein AGMMS49938_15600 [Fibrobacterales bacterium]